MQSWDSKNCSKSTRYSFALPVRLEVLGGARKEERKRLSEYFSIIPYRATTEQDWENAIALAWKARNQGLTMPWMDILIASICSKDNCRLYTMDKHFYKLSEFHHLRLYKPGYGGNYNPD